MDSNHRPSGYEPDELPLLHAAMSMVHGPTLPAGIPPVPSAQLRFTTRFGMGRGGSTALLAHHWLRGQCRGLSNVPALFRLQPLLHSTSSPREALVHALSSPPRVATPPARAAYPVISWGTYRPIAVSVLILRCISHLDAFSGSCVRT